MGAALAPLPLHCSDLIGCVFASEYLVAVVTLLSLQLYLVGSTDRSRPIWIVGVEIRRPVAVKQNKMGISKGCPLGCPFTRPQVGAYEANRRRRLLGRVW